VTAELNIHLEDPVFTKTAWHEIHKSNIHGRVATAKLLITESNAQMHKQWVFQHDNKIWTSDNWKGACDMVGWVVLHAVPDIMERLNLEDTQGSLQSRMPGSNSKTQGRFCDGLGSTIVVHYSVGPIITLHGRITVREYVGRLGNQVHHMIQTLFPRRQCPHSHSWNCSVTVWRAWRWTSTSSLASTITRFEHHWTILVSREE
jgi:hypothetical protein